MNRPVDIMADIEQFHQKFDLRYEGPPRMLPMDLRLFRMKFMKEELDEYGTNAVQCQDELDKPEPDVDAIAILLEGMLDALVDEIYVVAGTAYLHGFDFNEAWCRVHEKNMQKVRAKTDGSDSKRGSSHDVVKPAGWTPPSHADLVVNHAHSPVEF